MKCMWLALVVFAFVRAEDVSEASEEEKAGKEEDKAHDKRSLIGEEGYGSLDGYAVGGYSHGIEGGLGYVGGGELISQHVEVEKHVPIVKYQAVPYSVPQPVPVPVHVPVHVPQPVAVKVPVPVPVYRSVTVPVEKPVPYIVEKPYPVHIYKKVPVPVPKPYPVHIPIYKTKHIYREIFYPKHYHHGHYHGYHKSYHGW